MESDIDRQKEIYFSHLESLFPPRNIKNANYFFYLTPRRSAFFKDLFCKLSEYRRKRQPDSLEVLSVKSLLKDKKVFSLFYAVLISKVDPRDFKPLIHLETFHIIFFAKRTERISAEQFARSVSSKDESHYRLKVILNSLKQFRIEDLVIAKWREHRGARDVKARLCTDETFFPLFEFKGFLSEYTQRRVKELLQQKEILEKYYVEVSSTNILYQFAQTIYEIDRSNLLHTVRFEANVFNLFNLVELFNEMSV